MIRDVLATIENILRAQLPAKLDEIDAARGTTTEDVVDFFTTPRDEEKPYRHPAIFIVGLETAASNRVGKWRALEHQMMIVIEQRNANEEELEREIERYVEAIEKVLSFDRTLGGAVDDSEITRHDYSEIAREDRTSPWTKSAAITMAVRERYMP